MLEKVSKNEKLSIMIRLSAYKKDLYNIIKYGRKAPLRFEKIYVQPEKVTKRIVGIEFGQSALVYTEKWPTDKEKEINDKPLKMIMNKYEKNLTWQESGYIEYRLEKIKSGIILDGVETKKNILERCRTWDNIYYNAKKTGVIYSQKEIKRYNFRERGGIMISVSDKGQLIKTGQGNHRLLIAQILNIPIIPAQIGVVHIESLEIMEQLRINSNTKICSVSR